MRYIAYIFILFIPAACSIRPPEQLEPGSWKQMDQILASIRPPAFPGRTYDITSFGAKGDSHTDCLPAIRAAIEKCHNEGGGKVEVPAGVYLSNGPIHLKSNVNLHISKGATIKYSTDPAHYLPVVYTRWEGSECWNYSPLIYAFEQENIAVTGSGTLDGQAGPGNWWAWVNKAEFGWKEGMPSQKDSLSGPRLIEWNTLEVPVDQRVLGQGAYLRPNFIQPYRCKNILIDSVTIRNSPMWVINPVLSENITIQNVSVISHGPNSDGCDPESCRNVLIRNCYFDTGDDCIALKSGRNQDGRRIGRPIENVVVQGCQMKDGHGGVVIGSEVSGGARNIFAENCLMDSPNLERAIRVKTNKVRGGTIENLFFRNITVGEVREAVVRVNMRYPIYADTNQVFIPTVRNIFVENVSSSKSRYGLLVEGYDDANPVNGLHLKGCRFDGVKMGDSIKFAEGLSFEGYYLNGTLVEVPAPK
ncbi:MAG: glycoside hydrolase family 28 protein [Phaeodactylibacter sp.]|nr:glycoside hydrolase family 28 protein [Phaeodactylibacter sp.]MCB9274177.1 glycoside hydrolase family 28 protein [Lewinellaceae bacterium]